MSIDGAVKIFVKEGLIEEVIFKQRLEDVAEEFQRRETYERKP